MRSSSIEHSAPPGSPEKGNCRSRKRQRGACSYRSMQQAPRWSRKRQRCLAGPSARKESIVLSVIDRLFSLSFCFFPRGWPIARSWRQCRVAPCESPDPAFAQPQRVSVSRALGSPPLIGLLRPRYHPEQIPSRKTYLELAEHSSANDASKNIALWLELPGGSRVMRPVFAGLSAATTAKTSPPSP